MLRYTRLTALVALGALAFIQCGGDQKAPETPANEPAPSPEPPSNSPSDADAGAITIGPARALVPAEVANQATSRPAAPSAHKHAG